MVDASARDAREAAGPFDDPAKSVYEIVKGLRDTVERQGALLREIAGQQLGAEMEYPMNADWRGGFETCVRKARALVGEPKK